MRIIDFVREFSVFVNGWVCLNSHFSVPDKAIGVPDEFGQTEATLRAPRNSRVRSTAGNIPRDRGAAPVDRGRDGDDAGAQGRRPRGRGSLQPGTALPRKWLTSR